MIKYKLTFNSRSLISWYSSNGILIFLWKAVHFFDMYKWGKNISQYAVLYSIFTTKNMPVKLRGHWSVWDERKPGRLLVYLKYFHLTCFFFLLLRLPFPLFSRFLRRNLNCSPGGSFTLSVKTRVPFPSFMLMPLEKLALLSSLIRVTTFPAISPSREMLWFAAWQWAFSSY